MRAFPIVASSVVIALMSSAACSRMTTLKGASSDITPTFEFRSAVRTLLDVGASREDLDTGYLLVEESGRLPGWCGGFSETLVSKDPLQFVRALEAAVAQNASAFFPMVTQQKDGSVVTTEVGIIAAELLGRLRQVDSSDITRDIIEAACKDLAEKGLSNTAKESEGPGIRTVREATSKDWKPRVQGARAQLPAHPTYLLPSQKESAPRQSTTSAMKAEQVAPAPNTRTGMISAVVPKTLTPMPALPSPVIDEVAAVPFAVSGLEYRPGFIRPGFQKLPLPEKFGLPAGFHTKDEGASAEPPSPGSILSVAISDYYTCAVARKDGDASKLKCWGIGPGLKPTLVDKGLADVSGITIREDGWKRAHCAWNTQGELHCWGTAWATELEIPTQQGASYVSPGLTQNSVRQLGSGTVQASLGTKMGCAITSGALHCWGDPLEKNSAVLAPFYNSVFGVPHFGGLIPSFNMPSLSQVVRQSTSGQNACAVKNDGSLWCQGSNSTGVLEKPNYVMTNSSNPYSASLSCPGDGSVCTQCGPTGVGNVCQTWVGNAWAPKPVSGMSQVSDAQVTTEGGICAVVGPSHALKCWGHLNRSEFGDLVTSDKAIPTSCTGTGGYCYGGLVSLPTPVQTFVDPQNSAAVVPVTQVKSFDINARWGWGCAALQSGRVQCWGSPRFQSFSEYFELNGMLKGITDADQVVVGKSHACVVHGQNRRLSCFGLGELVGDGVTYPSPTGLSNKQWMSGGPVPVTDLFN